MDFEQLLLFTLDNSNETREKAEITINQLKEENYQLFLSEIINLISNPTNFTAIYISFTIILQDIRNGRLFKNSELFESFFDKFKEILENFFFKLKLDQAVCNILSKILALINQKYPPAKTDQFLIQSIEKYPDLNFFFIDTLATILFNSTSLNNTPFDVFAQILSIPLTDNVDFNSKFFLIFGLIHHFPDREEEIHNFFSEYLSNVPKESHQYSIHTISKHVKKLNFFFNDHIDDIITFIEMSIENSEGELSIQAEAVDCLANISIAYDNSSEIISKSLTVIFQMLEVEGVENSEIESVLKNSICNISCKISNMSVFFEELNKLFKDYHFAYLIAISEISIHTSLYLSNNTGDCYDRVSSFLTESAFENVFRIKAAAYLAIENLCSIIGPMFQEQNFNRLFPLLFNKLMSETDLSLIELILRCLSKFFGKVKIDQIDENIINLFTFLVNLFIESEIKTVKIETINVIENLSKSLSALFNQFYPALIQKINELLESNYFSTQKDILIHVIKLISEIIQIESIQISNKEELLPLLECSLEMLNEVENESDLFDISQAIISFMILFGDQISHYLTSQIVPAFLNSSSSEIEITHFNEENEVESIPGFIQVSPLDFAKKSSIISIEVSLKIIYISFSILKNEFEPFSQKMFEIVSNWINFQFDVKNIKHFSWEILGQLNKWIENPDIIDINNTIQLFLNDPQNEINSENSCSVLEEALAIGVKRKSIDNDLVVKLFEAFTKSLLLKFKKLKENSDSDSEEEDDEYNDLLKNEIKFFKFCLENLTDITVDFYKESIVPNLPLMIDCPSFSCFVIKVTTCYIIVSNDLDFFDDFQQFLFGIKGIESEKARISMKSIGKLFEQKKITFSENFYIEAYHEMMEILTKKDSFENDSLQLLSETIVSFTKLISNHSEILNKNEEIDLNTGLKILFESIPMLINYKKYSTPFDFVSFLICNKTSEITEIIEPANLIILLLDSLDHEAVSNDNKNIFISFIKQFIADKGNPIDEKDENRNRKLQEILKIE